MSPAFLNRFKIIYFEDQLNDLELNEFVKYKIDNLNLNQKTLIPNNSKGRINPRFKRRGQVENNEEKKVEKENFINNTIILMYIFFSRMYKEERS